MPSLDQGPQPVSTGAREVASDEETRQETGTPLPTSFLEWAGQPCTGPPDGPPTESEYFLFVLVNIDTHPKIQLHLRLKWVWLTWSPGFIRTQIGGFMSPHPEHAASQGKSCVLSRLQVALLWSQGTTLILRGFGGNTVLCIRYLAEWHLHCAKKNCSYDLSF